MRLYHGIMFQLVSARHPHVLAPTQPWGPAGRPSAVPPPSTWACSTPVPGGGCGRPSPGSPHGGVCTCACAWERLCVSSAPEAGSGSPDEVTLELDAGR